MRDLHRDNSAISIVATYRILYPYLRFSDDHLLVHNPIIVTIISFLISFQTSSYYSYSPLSRYSAHRPYNVQLQRLTFFFHLTVRSNIPAAMGTTSVRRNLFHHNLSRRPVSAAPSKGPMQSGGVHGMSGLSSQMVHPSSESASSSLSTGPIDNGDIVVRDKNGSYKLDIPVLPPVMGNEDGDEMKGVDKGRVSGGSGATGVDSTGQTEIISGHEKDKIEASLVEILYRNRNRRMSNEPTEILDLIYQSLRNKVASLDEDNWMYEPESDSRV